MGFTGRVFECGTTTREDIDEEYREARERRGLLKSGCMLTRAMASYCSARTPFLHFVPLLLFKKKILVVGSQMPQ
jgi:hypothetical protein